MAVHQKSTDQSSDGIDDSSIEQAIVHAKKESPDVRRKAKEDLVTQHARTKKLKLGEQAVRLQEQQVEKLN